MRRPKRGVNPLLWGIGTLEVRMTSRPAWAEVGYVFGVAKELLHSGNRLFGYPRSHLSSRSEAGHEEDFKSWIFSRISWIFPRIMWYEFTTISGKKIDPCGMILPRPFVGIVLETSFLFLV